MTSNAKKNIGMVAAILVLIGLVVWVSTMNSQPAQPTIPDPPAPSVIQQNFKDLTSYAVKTPLGPANAPYSLYEFADFQCPSCNHWHKDLEQAIQDAHGKANAYFVNLPLAQVHKHAISAAEVGVIADHQGKFWKMYDALYDHQTSFSPAVYEKCAEIVGLNLASYNADMTNQKYLSFVKSSKDFCNFNLDINVTPTIVVRDNSDGSILTTCNNADTIKDLFDNPPWDLDVEHPKTSKKSQPNPNAGT